MRFFLSLILVSGLIAPAFAQPADKAADSRGAEGHRLVTKAGGKAEIDPTLPDAARVSAKLEAATDATLCELEESPTNQALDVFDATRCTGKGFAAFKGSSAACRLTLGKSNDDCGPREGHRAMQRASAALPRRFRADRCGTREPQTAHEVGVARHFRQPARSRIGE